MQHLRGALQIGLELSAIMMVVVMMIFDANDLQHSVVFKFQYCVESFASTFLSDEVRSRFLHYECICAFCAPVQLLLRHLRN